jgi:hypothetical protein
MHFFVRVNGCGNAWPVFLGSEHPFYNRLNADDLGSASYSVLGCCSEQLSNTSIEWEVLIDAGHNTVPYLLKNENRIPEAVLLTHGHLDHILGVDWIAQSLNFSSGKKEMLSLYATANCLEQVMQTIPHLRPAIAFHELKPGVLRPIHEVDGLTVTAYPVFHGDSIQGAVMLLLEYENGHSATNVLFTGDLLFPFLCQEDYVPISKAQALYIDCSNRYCYPGSNHTSFTTETPEKNFISNYLEGWKNNNPLSRLVLKQLQNNNSKDYKQYFDRYIQQNSNYENIPFSVMEFIKKTGILNVNLVHYFGYHDHAYYRQAVMKPAELQEWANRISTAAGYGNTRVTVPKTGHTINLL